MLVYILNKDGKPLMPCSPRKARLLLKENKAEVSKRTPFTIQLLHGSSGYKQPITLGVDSGYEHIGLSATTTTREVFAAEVLLRKDIPKLLIERKVYRKTRRGRKTRYRQPRFLNRVHTKHKGWLAPSVKHKLDSHVRLVQKVHQILPIMRISVEVAKFNIQKIKNPDIKGVEYQQGEQMGFENVKTYVRYRDGHCCQHCKGKSKDPVLEVHHLTSRSQGGSDRPNNLVTLCRTCHDKVTRGLLKLKIETKQGFCAETLMNILRNLIVSELQKSYDNVNISYGYITKILRQQLGLIKSHINDAFCLANGNNINYLRVGVQYLIKQVRKQNRKLFKGKHGHIRNTAPRFLFGFQRYDRVRFDGEEWCISGRRITGRFKLGKLNGETLKTEPNYRKLKLLESFQTFLWEV